MPQTKSIYPESILFVCVGNSCRSPIAEAFALKRWPRCKIKSAGTKVFEHLPRATNDAISVMKSRGIDISCHKTTRITDINTEEFQYVVAMGKKIRRQLIDEHSISELKIKNLFVKDPFDDDIAGYEKCATKIEIKITELSF